MAKAFVDNLIKSSVKAADFLREKNLELKGNGLESSYFSSEKEFVAEMYRLMIKANKKYRRSLLIDYHKPKKNDREFVSAHPDIAYYDSSGGRCAVEAKGVWYLTAEGGPYQADVKRIMDDLDKLHNEWKDFESKVLIVAYLGDGDKYKRNRFQSAIEGLTQGDSGVSLIVC